MAENFVKQKLASGATVLGTWNIMNSPVVVEVMATAGLDFQILDMEHGSFDFATLDGCIHACASEGCSPLVRVGGIEPVTVQRCLDIGAHGIVFPQVLDRQSAEAAVKTTRYAPDGNRGFNPFTRAGRYNGAISSETSGLTNGFGLTTVIIENASAYQDLDAILRIPSLDVVYLGVYDMSVALGHPGDVKHPDIENFVKSAVPRIRKAGKTAGLMVWKPQDIRAASALGANLLVYRVDAHVLKTAVGEAVAGVAALEGARR